MDVKISEATGAKAPAPAPESGFWKNFAIAIDGGYFRLDEHNMVGGEAGLKIPLTFLDKERVKFSLPISFLYAKGSKEVTVGGGSAKSQRIDKGVSFTAPRVDWDFGSPGYWGMMAGLFFSLTMIDAGCSSRISEEDQEWLDTSAENFRNSTNNFEPDNRAATCALLAGGTALSESGSSFNMGLSLALTRMFGPVKGYVGVRPILYQNNNYKGFTAGDSDIPENGHVKSVSLFAGVDIYPFLFGGGEAKAAAKDTDTDQDGVADDKDRCPEKAAPGTADGCPVEAAMAPASPSPATKARITEKGQKAAENALDQP